MSILSSISKKSRVSMLSKLKDAYALSDNPDTRLLEFVRNKNNMVGLDINSNYGNISGTLISMAIRQNDYPLFEELKKLGARDEVSFENITFVDELSIWCIDIDIYKYILEHGYEIDSIDRNGFTFLVSAIFKYSQFCKHGDRAKADSAKKLIEYLLDNGADINSNGIDGLSPLICASRTGMIDIVEMLIGRNVDISRRYKIRGMEQEQTCNSFLSYIVEKGEDIKNIEQIKNHINK